MNIIECCSDYLIQYLFSVFSYSVIFGWQKKKKCRHHSSIWITENLNSDKLLYRAPDLCMKNPGSGFGWFMIDDRCRCGRHVNIPKYLDILLIIVLSQSILIRPLKSLIGVNNWRRCDTPVNVDVMSWMASICRTLGRRVWKKYAIFCYFWAVVKNDPLPCLIEIDETANSCLLITTFASKRWKTEEQRVFCWSECIIAEKHMDDSLKSNLSKIRWTSDLGLST